MRGLLIAFILSAATSAMAQERMTDPECEGVFDALRGEFPLTERAEVSVFVSDDGWCEVTGLEVETSSQTAAAVEKVRWRASDIERFLDEGLLPRALELDVIGFRSVYISGDPLQDYLFDLQRSDTGLNFGVSARWDGIQNALFVENAYADLGPAGEIEMSARINDVDLTDTASLQLSAGTAAVQDVLITAEFDGWFEQYVAQTLGYILLNGATASPAEDVARLQGQAVALIEMVPDTTMPEQSKDFLSEFVMALPRPRGTLRLQFSADPAFGMARLLQFAASGVQGGLEPVMEGVTLLATWTQRSGSE